MNLVDQAVQDYYEEARQDSRQSLPKSTLPVSSLSVHWSVLIQFLTRYNLLPLYLDNLDAWLEDRMSREDDNGDLIHYDYEEALEGIDSDMRNAIKYVMFSSLNRNVDTVWIAIDKSWRNVFGHMEDTDD